MEIKEVCVRELKEIKEILIRMSEMLSGLTGKRLGTTKKAWYGGEKRREKRRRGSE